MKVVGSIARLVRAFRFQLIGDTGEVLMDLAPADVTDPTTPATDYPGASFRLLVPGLTGWEEGELAWVTDATDPPVVALVGAHDLARFSNSLPPRLSLVTYDDHRQYVALISGYPGGTGSPGEATLTLEGTGHTNADPREARAGLRAWANAAGASVSALSVAGYRGVLTLQADDRVAFVHSGGGEDVTVDGDAMTLHAFPLHVVNATAYIQGTGAGSLSPYDVFDTVDARILIVSDGMNTTRKYTPAVLFGSTDSAFTTTKPKPLAGIGGYATQTYQDDLHGGMGLALFVTRNNPGATPSPTEAVTINALFFELEATIELRARAAYDLTTASAANAHISAGGQGYRFVRSTSSARYKRDVEPLDPAAADRVVAELRPVWFRSTASNDRPDWSHYGLVAEEVAEVDPRLVHWSEDEAGDPLADGVQYDRIVPHLLDVVRRLSERVAVLEADRPARP